MPVPNSIDELKPNPAENFPIGSEAVFPNLDNYMRFLASCVAQLRDRMNAEGLPLAAVMWWGGARSSVASRMAAMDGQMLNRAEHPGLWAFVSGGGYPLVAESEWLATPTKRASFSSGDGSTTFRMPDLNGMQVSSIGSVTVRGDGAQSAGSAGLIQDSQNIAHTHGATVSQSGAHSHSVSGTASTAGGHSHSTGVSSGGSGAEGNVAGWNFGGGILATSTAGAHSHEVSGTASSSGSHVHSISIENTGGSESRAKVATGVWVMRVK